MTRTSLDVGLSASSLEKFPLTPFTVSEFVGTPGRPEFAPP
jgi:hypothetical protein